MRKTVKLAQYQVATVGTPVDLLYHYGPAKALHTTEREAQVTHGEWYIIIFLIYTHRDYVKII